MATTSGRKAKRGQGNGRAEGGSRSDGKPIERQREEQAEAAREHIGEKRDKASGAAGWIADRAGEWSLREVNEKSRRRQAYLWNFLMDHYWRMEIEGWHR